MKIKHFARILTLESLLHGVDYLNGDMETILDEIRTAADNEETGESLRNYIFETGLEAIADSIGKIRE